MTASQETDFIKAFDWAVVRLSTYFPASASKARLLFGTVSLLTKDRGRPLAGEAVESCKIGKGKSGKVFFRRTVLTASDAVAWYRRAGTDGIVTPTPSGENVIDERNYGVALTATAFEDDPPWPSLGVPLGTDLFSNAGGPGDPAPFRGTGAPRIHRRFGDHTGFGAVLADDAAIRFLRRRLHLDLADYTEYLGGLALVVPDPILRLVRHFLVPAQKVGEPERLIYRLVPRSGERVTDLKLTVLERRSNLLSRFETVNVPESGVFSVESALPFDQTGYAISHPTHGVIAYQQPLPFIRSVRGTFGIAGRRVKFDVPRTESPRSPTDTYETTEYAHEIPFGVGKDREDDPIVTVVEAEQRRIRRAAAIQYKQTWFDGNQRDKAVAFLRG